MTLMEYNNHAKVHNLAKLDREVRKCATPNGIKLWSKLGVPAGVVASQDTFTLFTLVETGMYRSIVDLYDIIKEKHWK